ncbi:hypothetical protein CEE37_08730 [candidate division LCP-89 bacterium B3_LCP]|uniref:Radical SAM core domain-containing protein n=1 Tax=candidate division LCP-89 bacterium B3_LCP TaxID=2012998 RepID=A0A532UZL3_UNCL8|nr:MAG: hypothetical protein CEE37_08730 [candidate division LCP-89 bacterium B3_LCP]
MIPLSAPIDVSIELTARCNLHCLHCFQPDDRKYPALTTNEILDIGHQMAEMGVFAVFLSGGEPLLNPDWSIIGSVFVSLGLTVGLSTNGTLITLETALKIKELGLYKALQVSIEGSTPRIHDAIRGEGSFEKTVRGLDHLAEVGIYPNIAVTVMKPNIHDVPNIIDFALRRNLNHVHVMSLMPAGRAKKHFQKLDPSLEDWISMEEVLQNKAHYLKGKISVDWGNRRYLPRDHGFSEDQYTEVDRAFTGCPAGKSKAVIDFGGFLYGCDLLKYENICAGNIRQTPIAKIWNSSSAFSDWRSRTPESIIGKCKYCKWLFACVGGCPALSIADGFTMHHSDPSCPGPVNKE